MRFKFLILPISALLTLGCGTYYSNLVIENKSRDTIRRVTVVYPNGQEEFGDIEPGNQVVFTSHVSGEGSPLLLFDYLGRRVTVDTCYYTATFPPRGTITVYNDRVERRCE